MKKKYCYSANGEILFEYSGSLQKAFYDYMEKVENNFTWQRGYIPPVSNTGRHFVDNKNGDCPHYFVDLSGMVVELSGEGFDGFNVSVKDFHGSTFKGSCLYWAIFSDCNLENVDFSFCDLRGCPFDNSILISANLQCANLSFSNVGRSASFCNADLTNANLEGANLNGVIYDSKTIFPIDFIVPEEMFMKNGDENNKEFMARYREWVRLSEIFEVP